MSIAKARYRTSNIFEHQNNPLILALPMRLEDKQVSKALSINAPIIDISDLDRFEHESCLTSLRKTRVVTMQHLEFYHEVYGMIIHGYIHRNPQLPAVTAWSYDIADPSVDNNHAAKPTIDSNLKQTTADAMFVTGFSGNGKSTMLTHVLGRLFPQVIEHDYQGFQEPQIVYLKCDLPHNASRSGLIINLLRELDRVLANTSSGNPKYSQSVATKSGKHINIDAMMNVLMTALNRHHVGLIIIDEFQNLHVSSHRYRLETIQLFDELSNILDIPSIKIGTPDTLAIFDRNSRHKRRLGKPFELQPFKRKEDVARVMKQIFAFQPITNPIERDEVIEKLLLELTAGVPAYLFGLWEATLLESVRTKHKINEKLIMRVFKKRFPLLRLAIRNIRQGKKGRHDDLLTVQQYLDSGNNDLALKHIDRFTKKSDFKGNSAQDVIDDIDQTIEHIDFTSQQLTKLKEIKATLALKKQETLGPQTLEHQ